MSTNTAIKTAGKKQLTIKTQVLATLLALIGSVAIPQMLHVISPDLGGSLLPMHLPVILVGLLAGPYAGLSAGLLGPLCSFALSGMPGMAMLPFMMIELAVYGLSAGLLRNAKLPVIGKVVAVQLAGRLVRAIAILTAVYGFNSEAVQVSVIWNSIVKGLPGLALQWVLLPIIVFWVDKRNKNEH